MIARLLPRRVFARHALAALVACISLAVAAPAFAQAPAANPSPSPAAILIAKQILQLKDTKQNIYTPLVRGVIEKAKDEFMQTNFMWAKDLNEVAANMEKQYAPRADELLDAAARIYASHFTEAELRQILAWDQSPVGKKEMAEEPKILHDSLAQAGEWGQNFSLEVINQMRAEMKKRGHDI